MRLSIQLFLLLLLVLTIQFFAGCIITHSPQAFTQTLKLGETMTFQVTVQESDGADECRLQWYLDDVAISGAHGNTYTFSAEESGIHRLKVEQEECSGSESWEWEITVEPDQLGNNMSDFSKFEYYQKDSNCAAVDSIKSAIITRTNNDALLLEIQILEEVSYVDNECQGALVYSDEKDEIICIVSQDLPDRYLNDEEVEKMLETFHNIEVRQVSLPEGLCVWEPCPMITMKWDDNRWTNGFHTCGPGVYEVLTNNTINTVSEFLKTLWTTK
jgi:hypothetical protein